MAKEPMTYKGLTLQPNQVTNTVTGEVLTKTQWTTLLSKELLAMQALVQWQLEVTDQQLLDDLRPNTDPAPAAGLYLGLSLPKQLKQEIFSSGDSGVSRFERVWRGETIAHLRSWSARKHVVEGTSQKYVSAGWKRTADATRPTVSPKMNLGYADAQYSYWDKDYQHLNLVIDGQWHLLEFCFPNRVKGRVPSLPTLRLSEDSEVLFDFALMKRYQQRQVTERYVVGIDVGVNRYATITVWDELEQRIVYQSSLSQRVHSLEASVKASQKQVRCLRKKASNLKKIGRYRDAFLLEEEAAYHRRASSGKKRELAIIAAQEVAEVAFVYGNAVIVVEDLSWVKNTMAFGRWNRGEFVRWLTHYAELNGSRVIKTNAAYSSQECWSCEGKVWFKDYSWSVCNNCGTVMDRDLNASAVLARRGVKSVRKLVASRKKSKRFVDAPAVRESPQARERLRRPGTGRRAARERGQFSVKKFSPCAVGQFGPSSNVARDGQQLRVAQDSKKATLRFGSCSLPSLRLRE